MCQIIPIKHFIFPVIVLAMYRSYTLLMLVGTLQYLWNTIGFHWGLTKVFQQWVHEVLVKKYVSCYEDSATIEQQLL